MKKYLHIGIEAVAMLLLTVSFLAIAGYTPEAQYNQLHADFEAKLSVAYDSYEDLLLFMEKQAVDKQDYDEALRLQTIRENRANWEIDFMTNLSKSMQVTTGNPNF